MPKPSRQKPKHYPARRTPKRGLRQVDFVFDGNEVRGLEQNPQTKSRWAQMARSGKKVMQFLSEGPLHGERGRWHGEFVSQVSLVAHSGGRLIKLQRWSGLAVGMAVQC